MKTCPEVWELVDDGGIVANGTAQVAGAVEQQGTVEDCHEVLRLVLYDEVEVGDGAVVVAHLHPELSSVVVSEEVFRVYLDGLVIVGHCSANVVDIITCKGAVYIVSHGVRLQVYGLAQLLVGIAPLLAGETYHGAHHPCLAVVGVFLKALVQILSPAKRVFLLKTHLCL